MFATTANRTSAGKGNILASVDNAHRIFFSTSCHCRIKGSVFQSNFCYSSSTKIRFSPFIRSRICFAFKAFLVNCSKTIGISIHFFQNTFLKKVSNACASSWKIYQRMIKKTMKKKFAALFLPELICPFFLFIKSKKT